MNFIKEFREFAMRGNVVDMAVGVIIGSAFGKIVSSLVSDIFMPVLGILTGGIDFKDMKFILAQAQAQAQAQGDVPAVTLNYGLFIQNVIDFIIIAFAIFMIIKVINKVRKPEEKKPVPKAETLLTEIRDLLKNK
ncbi:Large-conductance mechanosensitive channel [Haemophilus influenzae]|uniref:large-conductance mechanosensitive channel protein MscL n=1 Tax=Haemophilus influenzae TaxID=727 RepID=UPI000D01A6D9|nr:large-conductance mechanosensitive channel protein MscL [Haemophilus influenzae]PRJ95157.1 Large-conductance mechanosensitive channel [Haemophilus influenzae]PRK61222.1 Large-conductance mechanosensitive channel [Haemophilus influenzae]PRM07651.1 Large-conductance mechanosensitive channel [Haemophilus influenzae]PRM12282.1 Large-conductance mechanosensitive channel [Haemophilus influenzae]